MKKLLIIGAVVIVALVVLGAAGYAYAQTQTPPTPNTGYGMMGGLGRSMMGGRSTGVQGTGRGMMGGRNTGVQGARQGAGGGYGMMANSQFGPMHDEMIAALAGKLGLTVDELNTRIANGETPYAIAQSQGKTAEEITALFNEAHDEALQAAVAAGTLTQAQADWMDQHHESMWGGEDAAIGGPGGSMPCHNGAWNAAPTQAPSN